MTSHTGSCLCGGVTFNVSGELQGVLHCHCINCRKVTGNFVAAARCQTSELAVADPDQRVQWYDLGYARYGFCGTCGSTMFWQGSERPETTSIQTGVLDDVSNLPLDGIWFANEAMAHNTLNREVAHFDGNAES